MFWLAYLALTVIALFGYIRLLAIAFRYEKVRNHWPEEAAWQWFLSMPRPDKRWHYLTVTLKEAARAEGRSGAWRSGMGCLYLAFFGMIGVGILHAVKSV
ncbi:hypothetical protein [Oricola cellulosilytica]|uniref:Uncharacterized protein n=1 Tax=Oricola cellulosilytica TaxID=1429082 RepID=A0A4R0PEQ9_9HYPH|nr:hypothetical protein [Oricola cellulosilytica]TCD14865.1 hypothetical protein E0D97_04715 [Oricola cellulosilytica]